VEEELFYVPPGRYHVVDTPSAPTLVIGYALRLFGAGRSSVIYHSNVTVPGQPLLRSPLDALQVILASKRCFTVHCMKHTVYE
jgi:hypothetical protein